MHDVRRAISEPSYKRSENPSEIEMVAKSDEAQDLQQRQMQAKEQRDDSQNGNEGVSRAGEGNTGNSGVRHSFNVNVSVLGKGGAATNEVAEWSTALKGLSDADSEETILERDAEHCATA